MKAYFAGGCFWCIAPIFRLYGVERVVSGYAGGTEENPAYEDVKNQKTGHRETVMLEYDPAVVSYGTLLDLYFGNVDPFDPDGQFIDRGRSYTLAVYYTNEAERSLALQRIGALARESGRRVFVSVEPFTTFYPAEEYHQDYDLKNPEAFERELAASGRKEKPGN